VRTECDRGVQRGRQADVQRQVHVGIVRGTDDVRRIDDAGLRKLRDPDPDLQRRRLVGMGHLLGSRGLLAWRNTGVWNRGNPELRGELPLGCLHRPNVHGSRDPGLRKLREPEPDVQQRHVVGLGNLRRRRRLFALVEPASVRQRRHADVQRKLPVGFVSGPDMRRQYHRRVRQLRDDGADVQQRRLE
jgi:hypothetical protein